LSNLYNAKKTLMDGIWFASKAEAYFYLLLKQEKEEGKIIDIDFQPKYILQEGFTYKGVKLIAITYKADFKVTYADGSVVVIDVKGKKTEAFMIKAKLFMNLYPDIDFRLYKRLRSGRFEEIPLYKKRKGGR
jgi:hypothetical protein